MAVLLPLMVMIGASLAPVVFAAGPVEITVLYDNTTTRANVTADWGFSALVVCGQERILFDSGAKPDLLLANMKALGVDPAGISKAVLSHAHGDHLNGIYRLFPFNKSMALFFLDAFPPQAFARAVTIGAAPIRVTGPAEIAPGIRSTGTVQGEPPEQALAIDTVKGLVVITGCSHPGVARMVEAARRQRGEKRVRLLLGGFHMLRDTEGSIRDTIARLKAQGVESVAATHCTGDAAVASFRKAFGERFREAGVGGRFVLD